MLALAVALAACSDGSTSGTDGSGGTTHSSSQGGGGSGGAPTTTGGSGGTGGAPTTGGSGGGPLCEPGSTDACYSGPPGTNGVGACKSGVTTCLPDGSAFGPCVGDVVPTAETCASPADDDCDGATNEDGPDCVCTPGSPDACYSGPPGTLGVGVCKAGTAVCNALGTAYGPCIGAVLPAAMENCATAADDNCDGSSGPCSLTWAKRYGDGSAQSGRDVAVDPGGNILLAAAIDGVADFGGGALVSAGSADFAVAKIDPYGFHVWSKRFGGLALDTINSIAADAAGAVIFTGTPGPTGVDFGGGMLPAAGNDDIVLVKLDAGGAHVWSKRFGGAGNQRGIAVAASAAGDVVLLAYAESATSVDFGGGALTGVDSGVLLAKFDAGGTHLWSKRFSTLDAVPTGLGVDAAGNIVIAGHFGASIDFGGGALTASGGFDVFLVKFDAAGNHLWGQRYGDLSTQMAGGVFVTPAGDIVLTGGYAGSMFAGQMSAAPGPVTSRMFVARFSAPGNLQWVKTGGGDAPAEVFGRDVVMDAGGNTFVTGTATGGSVDLGGGSLSGSSTDVFVLEFDTFSNYVFGKRYGNSATQVGTAIADLTFGHIALTGTFAGSIDFGQGAIVAQGDDVFLTRFTP